MYRISHIRNIFPFQQGIVRKRIVNSIYTIIFLYLLLYSITTSLYLGVDPVSKTLEPDHYDIENLSVTPITCGFTRSGQYERAPLYMCFILLAVTIIIRNHEWLAAGAAAYVLTYSGVAAIHLIVLFAANNRLNMPRSKLRCESINLWNTSTVFHACAGIAEPDAAESFELVSSCLLGALPIAAWSTTFRRSSRKPILIMWMLLLAISHVFNSFALNDHNRHFQICPAKGVEELPYGRYQAPELGMPWLQSLQDLVLSQSTASPKQQCLYSCFNSGHYIGRNSQDIGIYEIWSSTSANRRNGILFWWAYVALAALTLFTNDKHAQVPKIAGKALFSLPPFWRGKTHAKPREKISALSLVRLFTQVLSVAAYVGSIIETEIRRSMSAATRADSEPFSAVGQWSSVAVVGLVLIAALVSKISQKPGQATHLGESRFGGDEENVEEEWDHRRGYAS